MYGQYHDTPFSVFLSASNTTPALDGIVSFLYNAQDEHNRGQLDKDVKGKK